MESVNDRENKTLKFWKQNKIFEQSISKKSPKGDYIFYDGPPFITGLPHYGTILPSIVKDCVPRYWTMKGFRVKRIWGWDCHGLPAENQVEKELNLKDKKAVEDLGVKKFVCACKDYVNNVSGQWQWYIDRIARWVDMDNAYRTMDLKFMESVIWIFKELYDKGLIYEGYRASLHCPRCATPLSKFEITMDSGSYRDVTEMSVVIEFALKNKKDKSILAWTTTPWTLPGNLALAVGKKIKYVEVKLNNKKYILAKNRVEEILKDKDYKILKEFYGKDLVGLEYEPLFDLKNKTIKENKKVYKIYDADFVTTEDGTGVVHIAPNFGEEDFELGNRIGLPVVDLMDENGIYTEEAGKWKGHYFKDAGKEVMSKLKNKLFSKFNCTHSYPFCYRCSTPLIYKTQKAWYLNVDKIRKSMLRSNKNINWVPDYFKKGRFKYNLENAPHWCLSRSRYWGSPIPVWKCEKCEKIEVVGSINDIEKKSGKKVDDLHRPKIDNHFFKCDCGGKMKRIPEILDCWFESGSMPYAQWHYPFEMKENFKKIFPADFIIEYTGQLRGWFYYLHVLSNGLFGSECFKNVMVTGVLAGNDGRKMSKSYGNYPDPKETMEKYGGDALRMYFLSSPVIVGGDMNISEKGIQDCMRKNIMLLANVHKFYQMANSTFKKVISKNILDKWIISRLNDLLKNVTKNMEKYDVPTAARLITEFIEDLSTWYLRRSRERLDSEDAEALSTLQEVLETLSKIIAPFMPFLAETIWQNLSENNFKKKNKSVHLENWPKCNAKKINENLLQEMKIVREIVSIGLKERDQNKIGVRWPLASASVSFFKPIPQEYFEIIKEELNIKNLEILSGNNENIDVKLDFSMTPKLEAEGYARELSRQVQAFRKKIGLEKKDLIELFVVAEKDFEQVLKTNLDFIKERTNSKSIKVVTTEKEKFKNKVEFKIRDKKGVIAIK